MLNKTQAIIQGTYLLLFVFMTLGIIGNNEMGVKTPAITLIVYGVVCFLTAAKIIYWIMEGEI